MKRAECRGCSNIATDSCITDRTIVGTGNTDLDDIIYENYYRISLCKAGAWDSTDAVEPDFDRACNISDVFVISPVWKQVNENALQPYLAETISDTEAYTEALRPVRHFMMNLTRDKDLMLFIRFADEEKSMTADDILPQALVPAFVVSELRVAFQIGFILYVPFLMIDSIFRK